MIDKIKHKLEILQPILVHIFNESENHKGHSGYNNGNSHFKLIVISDKFKNKSRINRHKLIYDILFEEMNETIHSLSITAYTESEYKLLSNY